MQQVWRLKTSRSKCRVRRLSSLWKHIHDRRDRAVPPIYQQAQFLWFARNTVIWFLFLLIIFFNNRIRWDLDGNTIATSGITRGSISITLRLIGHGGL